MKVLVILEETLDDKEYDCLGVATSVKNADKIVSDYYGLKNDNAEFSRTDYECGDEAGMPVSRYKLEGYYSLDDNWYSSMIWYMEHEIDSI